MGVSTEEVRWAYRLLLGREPESDAAVAQHLGWPDRHALMRFFIACDEFTGDGTAARLVGRHLAETTNPVHTTTTDDEVATMLEGVARSWRQYGKEAPHWSVLTNPDFSPESIASNVDRFYATGRPDIDLLLAQFTRCGIDTAGFKSALDFGCGVGRLTLSLAERVPHVTGVDISEGHIRIAEDRARAIGTDNAEFRSIGNVEDISALGRFDLILCIIVLQHNPPPVIAAILTRLLGLLAPGGVAAFQVPSFIAGYQFDVRSYLSGDKPRMEMNPLPQPATFRIIYEAGCIPLEVREDMAAGGLDAISQTFIVQKV